jgi:hypothetical protein
VGASIASTFSRWLAAAACVAALALAGGMPLPAQSGPQRERGQVTPPPFRNPQPAIFFCTVSDVQCRNDDNQFYLNEVRDLFVFVAWDKVSGEHTARIRLLLPDGNLYQQTETRFTTQPQPAAAASPQGKVQVARVSRGEPTTVLELPVAGTHITQRSLAGAWTVEVELDGKPVARRNLIFLPQRP